MTQENQPELTEVRAEHQIDRLALVQYMRSQMDGITDDLTIRQFEGGQSNPTFLLESADRRWVLRKKPPGVLLKSAHAVEREYRVMKGLGPTNVPVPRMELLCEDESVIGTPFFVMEWVEGRIIMNPLESNLPTDELVLFIDPTFQPRRSFILWTTSVSVLGIMVDQETIFLGRSVAGLTNIALQKRISYKTWKN